MTPREVQKAAAKVAEEFVRVDLGFPGNAAKLHTAILALDVPEVSGWQPIESAPKDGTPILVWLTSPFGYGWTETVRWNLGGWWDDRDGYCRPSHWRPAFEPPTTPTATESDNG